MHGKQLHRGHAEPLQVLHGGRMRHPGVGAPQLLGHIGVQHREALHVHLVEDRVGHRSARTPVRAPVEVRADEDRARHVRCRVAAVRLIRVISRVTVDRRIPAHLTRDRAGVRVEQQLGRVTARARRRIPRPVHTISVALARPRARQIALPHVPVALLKAPARLRARIVEQAQLDPVRHAAEQSKARAVAIVMGAERRRDGGRLERLACGANRHQVTPSA